MRAGSGAQNEKTPRRSGAQSVWVEASHVDRMRGQPIAALRPRRWAVA
jgi:hypothetical protein